MLAIIEKQNEIANNYLTREAIDEYAIAAIHKYTDLLGSKLFEDKYNSFTNGTTFEQIVAKDAIDLE